MNTAGQLLLVAHRVVGVSSRLVIFKGTRSQYARPVTPAADPHIGQPRSSSPSRPHRRLEFTDVGERARPLTDMAQGARGLVAAGRPGLFVGGVGQERTPAPVVEASSVGRFFAEVSRPAFRVGVQLTVVFSFLELAAL